jgi:hypothetical protein
MKTGCLLLLLDVGESLVIQSKLRVVNAALGGNFTCIPDSYEPSNSRYQAPLILPVVGLELNLCDAQLDYDVFSFGFITETAITVWIDHDEMDFFTQEVFIRLTLNDIPLSGSSHVVNTSSGYRNTFLVASGLSGFLSVGVSYTGTPLSQVAYKMTVVPCAVDKAEISGCIGSIDWNTCNCVPTTGTSTLLSKPDLQ